MPIPPITLIIADGHTIARNVLAKTLEARKDIEVTAIKGNNEELISLCNRHQPDVVMMGARMPGINNMKPYRNIAAEFPDISVIIMADDNDVETIIAMKTAGEFAWLYFIKALHRKRL